MSNNEKKEEKEEKEVDENIEKFRAAGEIAHQIREELSEIVEPGKSFLDVAEQIENRIEEEDAKPAFPVNICVGNIAAHDTPEKGERILPEDEIIKIDFGASIDGFSSDTAKSFYFGDDEERKEMIDISKEALERGLDKIEAGFDLSRFGEEVESYVEDHGFNVVKNLTGHLIEQYTVHGDKEIPVTSGSEKLEAEKGEVYGVELFVTDGEGLARASEDVRIYRLISDLPDRVRLRLNDAREVLYYLREHRKELPFTPRWLYSHLGRDTTKIGVSILKRSGILVSYPILREEEDVTIAQTEHTIRVKEGGIEVLT